MEADISSQAVGLASNTDFSIISLFLRSSISAPFFPIIIPGLELYIEILNFFAALSIFIFAILALLNFFSSSSLLLKTVIEPKKATRWKKTA